MLLYRFIITCTRASDKISTLEDKVGDCTKGGKAEFAGRIASSKAQFDRNFIDEEASFSRFFLNINIWIDSLSLSLSQIKSLQM